MLHIFPQGLEGTLVIPIFVGLLVMAALTETLGWDFVGVVVPGYLASVCLSQPVVAAIVAVEAVATWALAIAIDRGLTASRVSHPVFGRDRFFLILVASVIVRITCEGFLFPAVVARWGPTFAPLQAHRHELAGIGLVLVPLCANRLWNPGLPRGLFQLVVETAIVVAVLQLLLVRFTNFSLTGFDPTYDPLALSFLTSPRAQMALLVTAAVASWCNRRYGWDFHGILVPALLGLAVLAPIKLVATVVEALLIMLISRALLTLPPLRRVNVEGARKVVLCFAVGVVFKMVAARTALVHLPGYRPSDLLGFGYLLPSLLAERIWRSQSVVLVLLPTLQTAVAGFVVTTAAALGLAIAAPAPPPPPVRFATLPQAMLALAPRSRPGGDLDGDSFGAPAARLADAPIAVSDDGYRIFPAAARTGLIALKPGLRQAFTAPLDEWAGVSAAAAARDGANLGLGPERPIAAELRAIDMPARRLRTSRLAPATPPSHSQMEALPLLRAVLETAAHPRPQPRTTTLPAAHPVRAGPDGERADAPALLRPLVEGAALQLDRARDRPAELPSALAPYGLAVTGSADGLAIAQGDGWPTVALRPGAPVVVAAALASEVGSSAAALAACEALQADCVLALDDAGLAVPLALALAERRGRPLLIVRGTGRALGADLALVGAPVLAAPQGRESLPAWLRPLMDLYDGRLTATTHLPADLGALHAFPPDAGRISPTVLAWCSPQARRILSGADHRWWSEDAIQQLVRQRGVPVLHTDGVAWLQGGRGTPAPQALELAETLARTSDVAQLSPQLGPARLMLLLDSGRDLVGFALEQGMRRALVLAGGRREERIVVDDGPGLAALLRRGPRTLLAQNHDHGGVP
jgi:hypothetical protein